MDPNADTNLDPINPAGEASLEQVGTGEDSAPFTEDHDELVRMQDEIDSAATPEEKAEKTAKRNSAFARMRRAATEAERTARNEALERARLQGKLEALESMGRVPADKPDQVVVPQFGKTRPRLDDFDTVEDYESALDKHQEEKATWIVEQRLAAERQSREQATQEQSKQERAKQINQWLNKGSQRSADFIPVVTDQSVPFTEQMLDLFTSSEVGHDLMYQLAKNPAEVRRLSLMPPHLAAYELAKHEAKITAKPSPGKKISSAPNPIHPVGGGETSVPDLSDPNISTADYMKLRREQEQAKKRK